MQAVNRFFKAVFNFFVGDWIILIGVLAVLVVVALVVILRVFDGFLAMEGWLLFFGFAATLFLTLRRETRH